MLTTTGICGHSVFISSTFRSISWMAWLSVSDRTMRA